MAETKPPKVFISYAWEDDIKTWVLEFATRLRFDGINAILDRWETVPGDQLTQFMEKAVRESDFVVFICTQTYKKKSDRRKGGVGYEGGIISGEIFNKNNDRKFIPVLRKGKWASASPSWATSKRFIDFSGNPYNEASYQQLLDTLFGKSPTAPPLLDNPISDSLGNVLGSDGDKIVNGRKQKISAFEKPKVEKIQLKKTKSTLKPNIPIIVAIISAVATIMAGFFNSPLIGKWFSPVSASTEIVAISTFASTLQPTETLTPAATLTPSVTPTYTPTFVLPESGYTIVDPTDVFKLVANTDPFGKIAKEEYTSQEINSVNRTLFYTIDGTPDQPMQWRWYWCATTEEILKQNVNGIDVVFQADGRLIPHEQLAFTTYSYPKDNGGIGWCATYSTVIKDWVPGVYHFVIASTLKSVINDGEATFLPGFQISDFTVKIREPALKTEIVDDKGVQMALVLGSSFQMGGGAKVDQQPIHAVYLNSYYIDAYEVSNALYKACVDANVCQPPKDLSSTTHPSYYTDPRFKNYPVVNVTWSEAETYCQWRDARLPTEAEWEKAARGVGGRTYPWGNLLECTYANYLDVGGTQCFVTGDTTPVDKYIKGVSPFGVYGLVGNVWEWVSDWYSETYYSVSPLGNPQGADSGQYRVMRGGSWKDDSKNMLPTLRNWYDPESYSNTIGFRCAKDAP